MYFTSILFLLLSPASIFAISVPRADNTKTIEQRGGCLPHTGFGSATVTFNNGRENDLFDYAVVTKYTTYYPKILDYALMFNGYKNTNLENHRICGWQKARSVHIRLGIDFHNHPGDIYWKYSYSTHTPSSTDQAPSEDTINGIAKILIDSPPAGDAYMFCTVILAWTTSLLGYILVMILLMACIKKSDRNANKSKDTEVDEGIELDSFKAPDGDSLAGTITAPTPFDDVKYIYASPQPGRTAITDTTHSDFLPTYSRQESKLGVTFDNVRLG